MKVTLRIPYDLPSGQVNGKEHFFVRAKRREKQREIVAGSWLTAVPRIVRERIVERVRVRAPLVVTFTRLGAQDLDDDNLVSGFKSARDALCEQLGCDDSPKAMRGWLRFRYAQERAPRTVLRLPGGIEKRGWAKSIRIELEEVDKLPEF